MHAQSLYSRVEARAAVPRIDLGLTSGLTQVPRVGHTGMIRAIVVSEVVSRFRM